MQQKVRDEVTKALYENVVSDFRLRLPQMPDDVQLHLDESVLMDVAEHGNQIVACAMLLWLAPCFYLPDMSNRRQSLPRGTVEEEVAHLQDGDETLRMMIVSGRVDVR